MREEIVSHYYQQGRTETVNNTNRERDSHYYQHEERQSLLLTERETDISADKKKDSHYHQQVSRETRELNFYQLSLNCNVEGQRGLKLRHFWSAQNKNATFGDTDHPKHAFWGQRGPLHVRRDVHLYNAWECVIQMSIGQSHPDEYSSCMRFPTLRKAFRRDIGLSYGPKRLGIYSIRT